MRQLRGGGGHVQLGARMLGRAEAGPGNRPDILSEPAAAESSGDAPPPPGADGTLLAIVPIPGTATSLAIVGYPVTAPGANPAAETPAAVRTGASTGAASAGQAAGERTGLLLEHDQRRVWVDGAEVPLTFQEFELLAFLAAHPAIVFSREDLTRRVWQRDFAADSRTVDVHVSRLRRKLGPAYAKCLVTEYRIGYQFRPVAR
jgi:Transcriptional regulatory protein, C terminal